MYLADDLGKLLKLAFRKWRRHEMMKEAAALSFYAALSLAPLLFILATVASSVLGLRTIGAWTTGEVGRFAGSSSATLVGMMMANSFHASANRALDVIELIVLVFGATNFFVRLSRALDVVSGVRDKNVPWSNLFKDYGKAFILTLVVAFLLAIFSLATAVVSSLGDFLGRYLEMPIWFLYFLNSAVLFVSVALLLTLLFRYLSIKQLPWRRAAAGAFLSALFLVMGEYLLGWVFGGGLIGSYGIAGSIIAFLTWIYYSLLLFLFGAEVAYAQPSRGMD